MSTTHRFNGIPINLGSLDQEGFDILQRHTNARMRAILGEIAVLNIYAAEQGYHTTSHVQLPDSLASQEEVDTIPLPEPQAVGGELV